MRMDCEAAREHLDAWALGSLDIYDQRQLESHVASCDACAALADEALTHAAMIGMAVPLRAASSTLKARVMASARALSDIGYDGWATIEDNGLELSEFKRRLDLIVDGK